MKTTITAIYDAVCQCNDSRFLETLQRLSNNSRPKFTDQELISIYLWGKSHALPTKKKIYEFAKEFMLDRFPNIPSYQAFCRRLNRISTAFIVLADIWQSHPEDDPFSRHEYVVDSCPIMLAKNCYTKTAKVARELCHVCHNSTKDQWYYGIKLHVFGQLREGTLPWPRAMVIAASNLSDLWAARDIVMNYDPMKPGVLFADRAYIDADWKEYLQQKHDVKIVTPRKKRKDDVLISGDAYSTHISSIRQPIESFFSWLNFQTNIQDAHFVRSIEGLYSHVFASLAVAALLLKFNS